jgi:hypothetical protein
MKDFAGFLAGLFQQGRISFPGRPVPLNTAAVVAASEVRGLLEGAFATYQLDIAGAPIAFDAGLACAAAEVVRQASWALVCHQDRLEDLEERLKLRLPHGPASPSQHLSVDLMLRYLPQVHRRARALDPADPLVGLIERVLRQWPLSGVLAGLDVEPIASLDFGGHEGLLVLYAERLALAESRRAMPAWRPAPGRPLEYLDLVMGRESDRDRDRNREPGRHRA